MHSLRRRDVSDALQERLCRLLHDFCERRREDLFSEVFLGRPDLRTDFAHRHGDAVFMAIFVGHEICKLGGVGGVIAVPDVVEESFTRFKGAVFARDEVSVILIRNG